MASFQVEVVLQTAEAVPAESCLVAVQIEQREVSNLREEQTALLLASFQKTFWVSMVSPDTHSAAVMAVPPVPLIGCLPVYQYSLVTVTTSVLAMNLSLVV